MKTIFLAATLTIFGNGISPSAQDTVPDGRQIDKLINEAKSSGQTRAQLPVFTRDYPVVTSLRQALKMTVPIRVSVEGKQTVVSTDGNFLITLYKV